MATYEVTRDGKILRGKEEIGFVNLSTGAITTPPLAPVAITHIKSQVFDLMMARRSEPDPSAPPASNGQEAATIPPPPDEFSSYQPPPAPRMDPKLGDKTPAYIEWFKKYFPDDYVAKYKGRRTHLTTGVNPHLSGPGDVPETHFGKDPEAEWK
jgi:hypothetical protein